VLPEDTRVRFVQKVFEILKQTLDDGFLGTDVRAIFRPEEFNEALERSKVLILDYINDIIEEEASNYRDEPTRSAAGHFSSLESSLRSFADELESDEAVAEAVSAALQEIDNQIENLEYLERPSREDYDDDFDDWLPGKLQAGRSIFADVDE
jgi:hypothetical protein